MKCFYHSADLDGHCSGAIVKMVYPECEMIGINYGDEFPWADIKQEEVVYMVDFSLQPFVPHMNRLSKVCKLVWIDHHKSAILDAKKEKWVIDNKTLKSGTGACQLVWEYLKYEITAHGYSGAIMPTFIKLLAEYDVWDHSDQRTLAFQYGVRQQKDTSPDNQDFWYSLFDAARVQRIVKDGSTILKYQMLDNSKYASACAFETELDELKCIAINKMLTNSQLFDSIWDNKKYDVMLAFGWRKGQWVISLYSDKEGIDVGAIAKKRGGGGHTGAAGFLTNELPFDLK